MLYGKKDELGLDAESMKLLEEYYKNFEIAGANLSEEDKEELKKYNARLATLTTQFGKTLLAANNDGAVTFTDKDQLAGLSEEARSEEHTSELQSRPHLVCRLLLEKK